MLGPIVSVLMLCLPDHLWLSIFRLEPHSRVSLTRSHCKLHCMLSLSVADFDSQKTLVELVCDFALDAGGDITPPLSPTLSDSSDEFFELPAPPPALELVDSLKPLALSSSSSWADESEDEFFDCSVFTEWGYSAAELESRGLLSSVSVEEEDDDEEYDTAADDRFVDLRTLRKPYPKKEWAASERDLLRRAALYGAARARAATMGFLN